MAIATKKAELIDDKKTDENALQVNETGIVDVETSLQAWQNYQELCTRLLNDGDYQQYKDNNGKIKRFPKKSAWFKLGKAFNVCTRIIENTVHRTKTGRVQEAYYRVEAYLPDGSRSVEADASCDVWEKGKATASGHDLRTTAETRATNRAISKLIGAGEVSAEEINNGDLKKVDAGNK